MPKFTKITKFLTEKSCSEHAPCRLDLAKNRVNNIYLPILEQNIRKNQVAKLTKFQKNTRKITENTDKTSKYKLPQRTRKKQISQSV